MSSQKCYYCNKYLFNFNRLIEHNGKNYHYGCYILDQKNIGESDAEEKNISDAEDDNNTRQDNLELAAHLTDYEYADKFINNLDKELSNLGSSDNEEDEN